MVDSQVKNLAERCRICNSSNYEEFGPKDGAVYYRCLGCGIITPRPLPTPQELVEYYDDNYTEKKLEGHGLHIRFKPEYFQAYENERDLTFVDLGFDLDWFAGKRIVDIGCANGIFLEYMKPKKAHAVGTDLSPQMVEQAIAKDLEAYACDVPELKGTFDAACLWDVIEHLLDPRIMLRNIWEKLNPGGVLFIQTPCTGAISDAWGSEWRNCTYPQHLHLFSESGLRTLLAEEGFEMKQHVRFGSGNTAGTIPPKPKRVFDTVAKRLGIGDTIALWAEKVERP
ncbi:MAG: hypothetical protein CMH50_13155 [Myxococcales bacterium]|nr:hypothetical protein [Myxococcales bacterium]